MKVLLVRPFNKYSYSFVPPLGLGYLASTLKVKGKFTVILYEAVRDKISSIASFYNNLAEVKPQVVGVQVYSVDLPIVKEYIQCVKNFNKQIITVVGGAHPSALPDETMSYFGSNLDFVISGEGERAFLSLINNLTTSKNSLENIPGLVWRNKEGEVVKNKKDIIENLDELPWPDWELLQPKLYPQAPLGGFAKRFPVAPIIVSRGCPMNCNFCAAKTIYDTGFRYRSIDDVTDEIKYLKKWFGIKEIMIQDDNITFKKSLILEFCEKVSSLNIDWNCLNGIRLSSIDDEIVKAMKEAGCYAVAVGIESGSQKILNDMNKKLKIEQIVEKINILAQYKIKITGQFIIGYPTETRDDILQTIKFAKKLPIERGGFSSFVPLPGSKVYMDLKEQGKLDDLDFGDMSYYNVEKSFTPHISKSELDKLLKKAIRSFHLRPLILLKIFSSTGSFSNLWSLLKRFLKNYV